MSFVKTSIAIALRPPGGSLHAPKEGGGGPGAQQEGGQRGNLWRPPKPTANMISRVWTLLGPLAGPGCSSVTLAAGRGTLLTRDPDGDLRAVLRLFRPNPPSFPLSFHRCQPWSEGSSYLFLAPPLHLSQAVFQVTLLHFKFHLKHFSLSHTKTVWVRAHLEGTSQPWA